MAVIRRRNTTNTTTSHIKYKEEVLESYVSIAFIKSNENKEDNDDEEEDEQEVRRKKKKFKQSGQPQKEFFRGIICECNFKIVNGKLQVLHQICFDVNEQDQDDIEENNGNVVSESDDENESRRTRYWVDLTEEELAGNLLWDETTKRTQDSSSSAAIDSVTPKNGLTKMKSSVSTTTTAVIPGIISEEEKGRTKLVRTKSVSTQTTDEKPRKKTKSVHTKTTTNSTTNSTNTNQKRQASSVAIVTTIEPQMTTASIIGNPSYHSGSLKKNSKRQRREDDNQGRAQQASPAPSIPIYDREYIQRILDSIIEEEHDTQRWYFKPRKERLPGTLRTECMWGKWFFYFVNGRLMRVLSALPSS